MGEKKVKLYKGELVEFEVFKLVDFYDDVLREPCVPFKFETVEDLERSRYLAFSLAETLSKHEGLGLSANQVGLKEKVCVVNMGNEIWTLFNPEIIESSELIAQYQEGCLSYPGLYVHVDRPNHIKVKFQSINGQFIEHEFDGLTAVVIQHEIDHLNGIMFTDKISPLKLEKAKRKVKQNLKKMKKYLEERNRQLTREESPVQSAKSAEIPEIKILNPAISTQKEPEKFVYNIG